MVAGQENHRKERVGASTLNRCSMAQGNTVGALSPQLSLGNMTVAKQSREVNHREAFELMLEALGDGAIDTSLFDPESAPFWGNVLRTTWEELVRTGYIEEIGTRYRLTAKGWLLAMEASGISLGPSYR